MVAQHIQRRGTETRELKEEGKEKEKGVCQQLMKNTTFHQKNV